MLKDSEGRYITAGQWHDEKFFAFLASAEEQAKAPEYLILGGMREGEPVGEERAKANVDLKKAEVEVY